MLAAATSITFLLGTAGTSSGALARFDTSSKHHTTHASHKKKAKKSSTSSPCLEGNWVVSKMTLSASGLTFSGGAGTTVDIKSNGDAVGNFTPSTPLTGSEGSAKFNGTITDRYGFSPKTTAHSGTFPATPVSNSATITEGGVTRPVTTSPETGTYSCSGKHLSLSFTSDGSTLSYQLSRAA